MHVAIRVLDIVVLVLVTGVVCNVAVMRGRRFLWAAAIFCAIAAVMRFHYGFTYSWAFLAKYLVTIAIPLIMAWAGNHLAAESTKTESEKQVWRGLFIALTILALGGSFWVLSNEEEQHQTELANLRGGIKSDMTTALVDYNNTHPQHQVTSEQFRELTKGLTALNVSMPSASRSDEDELTNISNARLEEMATDTAAQIKDFDERWYKARENQWLILDDLLHHDLTPREKQQALKEYQTGLQGIADSYWFGLSGRKLFITADKLRKAILGRLSPWQKGYTADTTNETEVKYLLSLTVAPDLDEKGIQDTPEYLTVLARRLKEK